MPHFVDCEAVSLGVDAARLEEHLREVASLRRRGINRRTGATIRALVVMHVFGHPCDLDAWPNSHAAGARADRGRRESLGSSYHGRHTGTWACSPRSAQRHKVVTTWRGACSRMTRPSPPRKAPHDDGTHGAPLELPARRGGLQLPLRTSMQRWGAPSSNSCPGCSGASGPWAASYERAFDGVAGVRFWRSRPDRKQLLAQRIVLDEGAEHSRDDCCKH